MTSTRRFMMAGALTAVVVVVVVALGARQGAFGFGGGQGATATSSVDAPATGQQRSQDVAIPRTGRRDDTGAFESRSPDRRQRGDRAARSDDASRRDRDGDDD